MIGKLSIYIHVPFCTKKCPYCHFFVLPNKKELQVKWFDSLKKEITLTLSSLNTPYSLVSIYFGGGTPSLIPPDWIGQILSYFSIDETCEITLEMNPEKVDQNLAQDFIANGINRISIGAQSFHDKDLITLGREHSVSKTVSTIETVTKAGCDNISLDLMYDLPNQTLADWELSLEALNDLPISHLSLYNLTFEPHTPFFRKKRNFTLPNEQESKQFFTTILEKLPQKGWEHYEISAFCKKGRKSEHNLGYWTGRPFIGLGPSAFGYMDGKRTQNFPSITKYEKALENGQLPLCFEEALNPIERRKELLVIGLRIRNGIYLPDFEPLENETIKNLNILEKRGWIKKIKNRVSLTLEGMLFFDSLATELI